MNVQPTTLSFEKRYSSGSGIEFAVRLTDGAIQFEAIDKVDIPVDQLGWVLDCLTYIAGVLDERAEAA